MKSTMQTGDLGVARLLRAAARFGAKRPVHFWTGDEPASTDMQRLVDRSSRLGVALLNIGLVPGDRVATMCAATPEHCEAYFGVPSHRLVLHALNIRMSDADLCRMLVDCGDRVLIIDRSQWDRFRTLAPGLAQSNLELILLTGGAPLPKDSGLGIAVGSYEEFLHGIEPTDTMALPDPDEEETAAICHTGGTTGQPKAVAYSHRSIWLQAAGLCLADSLALSRRDVALLAVPLYHVNGWGLPYAALMCGSGLALPGETFQPAVLHALMEDCGVTIAAGVPTIWTDYIKHVEMCSLEMPACLTRIATGGAVVPSQLVEHLVDAGIEVLQAWGMTETSSMSVVGRATSGSDGEPAPVGYPSPIVELNTSSTPSGEVLIRGACVTGHYLGADTPATDADGWLPTGDIGNLRPDGALVLTDRLKDAIKSGGEWIPAGLLEDAIRNVDWIEDVAVIAQPHERFQERPLAVTVLKKGARFDCEHMEASLRASVPSWWLPESWCLLDTLPRTTLGKPDKLVLRSMLAAGQLSHVENHNTDPLLAHKHST
ncbi:AMP-binding protein [Sediminimonas qiaohouensis]|uniref:AMP-binding protein n=1 Tax=Sediminimonas qiaohouensis TaxID=552061 RepID=UPI00040EA51A|nr:AMP-binding protein [Sediminimonas qiaohouensis]